MGRNDTLRTAFVEKENETLTAKIVRPQRYVNILGLDQQLGVDMKQCSKCNIQKPISDFYKRTSSRDGFHQQCKACMCANSIIWKKNNPEKRRASNKAYKKRYPEKVAAQKKRSYLRNPEKHIQRTRDYRLRNPETNSNWKKNNVEKVREYSNRRRKILIANGVYEIRASFLKRLYASACVVCGSKKRVEMDHVVPISRGGKHTEGNLQPLCKSCNAAKQDKLMIEFKMYLRSLQ